MRETAILYVLRRLIDKTKIQLFLHCFLLLFISRTTAKPIQVIILFNYSSIKDCSLEFIKYHSRSYFKPSFVDCWNIFIICIGSAFIDPETCPWVWLQIVSGHIRTRNMDFPSLVGLWKFMTRVPAFVIVSVAINTFIGFKAVPQILQTLVYSWWLIYKHHRRFFWMGFYIYKHDRRLFPLLGLQIYKHHRRLLLFWGFYISVVPRGTQGHWVDPFFHFLGVFFAIYL